jgi:hypothetical protein
MRTKINLPENRIPVFARLTGASTDILKKCSFSCRNAFNYAGMTIIFTAIVSSIVIAYAISTFSFKDLRIFFVIFPVWCLFIYLFDRLIILSQSDVSKWVRVFAILIIALFHSYVFDTITLKDDILTQLRKEYNLEVENVNAKYDSLIAPIQNRITEVEKLNENINKVKRSYIDSLQVEGRGLGGSEERGIGIVYRNLEKLKSKYDNMADEDIALNNDIIDKRRDDMVQINGNRNKELAGIVKTEDYGLMTQVAKMHQIVFIDGSITEKIFFAIWFGLFCFLESLPVLAKTVFRKQMKEYFKAADGEQENSVKAMEARKVCDWTVIQTEIQIELQLRLSKLASESLLKQVDIDRMSIHERISLLEEFLNDLEKIDTELKKAYPDYYEDYVKPEINKARKDFAKSVKFNS